MRVPKIFKNARIYMGDNSDLLVGAGKFTLPELAYTMEEVDAFGFGGKHEINTGLLEPMDFKVTLKSHFPEAFKLAEPITHKLTLKGDIQAFDQENDKNVSYPFEVQVSGQIRKFPLGEGEAAKPQDLEFELAAHKLKVILDGNEVMDIDIHTPKLVINGTDYHQDMRQHMGIG